MRFGTGESPDRTNVKGAVSRVSCTLIITTIPDRWTLNGYVLPVIDWNTNER